MDKITPFLWFDDAAEEAAKFYVSIFNDSKILDVSYYGDVGPGMKGKVMSVTFQLEGRKLMALNGGPHYKLTPAISLFVNCETQKEVDTLWRKLGEGGQEQQCGWITDKYGLTWQVIPTALMRLLGSKDAGASQRAMKAMLGMKKIDIAGLEAAAAG